MGNLTEMSKENVNDRAYVIFCSSGFWRMWDYLEVMIDCYVISAEEADKIEKEVFEKYSSWK